MSEERRVQLVATVDTTETRAGFQQIGEQAQGMAAAVTRASEQAERSTTGIGSGAERASRDVENAQRSLIASIQRTTAAMQAGSRSSSDYFQTLAQQRGVDPAALAPYIAQLRQVEEAQRAAAQAQRDAAQTQAASNAAVASAVPVLQRVGVSAGQTAAAMRAVPAQLNDIAVSLAGGQSPLMVLLQQGSQLRDQFGSIGGAARGVASTVAGLVNPYTIAAAAAVALTVAYVKGSNESERFARTLVETGNAAGATAEQMSEMARSIGAVAGSRGAASEVLVGLAESGRVAGDNLQRVARVIVSAKGVLSASTEDLVRDFAELGRSPVAALDKLIDRYHGISSATYAQVKSLQDQGRAAEAATIAQQAYADAVEKNRQKVLDTMTDWERGWLRIKNGTSDAVDAILNVGRDPTTFEKINALLEEREVIEKRIAAAVKNGDADKEKAFRADLIRNEADINKIRSRVAAQKAAAKAEADANAVGEARNKWLKDSDQYLDRVAQRELALTKARNEGAAAQLSQSEIDKRLNAIRLAFADTYNDKLDKNIAAIKRKDQAEEFAAQRELARIQAMKALGALTDEDAVKQAAAAEIGLLDKKIASAEAVLAVEKRKLKSDKEIASFEEQIDKLKEERQSKANKRDTDLLVIQDKRLKASEDLFNQGIQGAEAERNAIAKSVEADKQRYEQLGLTKAQVADLTALQYEKAASQKEDSAASIEALEPGSRLAAIYRDQAAALRERAGVARDTAVKESFLQEVEEAKKAADQISQSLTDAIMRGGKSAAEYLRDLFRTLVLRPILQPVGNFVGSALTSTFTSGSAPGAASAGGASSPIAAAQMASNLYNAVSGGLDKIGAGIANTVQSALNRFDLPGAQSIGNSTFAQSVGQYGQQAIGTVGGYMIGSSLNSVISGQYQVGSGFQTAEKIGTAIASYFGGPIGGAIAGAVSGLINRAFGMGSKDVTSAGIRGTLSASGVMGSNYSNWHQDGGWFRSDKNGTDVTPFGADLTKQFNEGFTALKDSAAGFAASIGISADSLKDYSKTFDIALGKDQAANEAAITAFFTGLGDEIAKSLVPTLDTFTKSGESAAAALQRLAGDFEKTNQVAQLLGTTAESLFRGTGLDTAAARERLVGAAGGADILGQQAAFYNQNFLTEEQRIKPVAEALSKAMASLGLASVTTREQFRDTVDGLIASGAILTEDGAQKFESLMKLAGAFDQVAKVGEAAADREKQRQDAIINERKSLQDQLDELTLSNAELLQKQRDALDESNRAIFDQIQATKEKKAADEKAAESAKKAADAAIARAKQLADAQATALQTMGSAILGGIDAARAAAKSFRELSDSLFFGSDSPLKAKDQYAFLKAQLNDPNTANMKEVVQQFLSVARGMDSTLQYARDVAFAQARLQDAANAKDYYANVTLPENYRRIAAWMSGSVTAHANGGIASGWSLVGEQGPEIVNFTNPARVYTASQSRQMIGGGGASDEMMGKMLDTMKEILTYTRQHAQQFDNVTAGGNEMAVAQ